MKKHFWKALEIKKEKLKLECIHCQKIITGTEVPNNWDSFHKAREGVCREDRDDLKLRWEGQKNLIARQLEIIAFRERFPDHKETCLEAGITNLLCVSCRDRDFINCDWGEGRG